MGPLGPLPWKDMGHILKSWDNDPAHHKSEGLMLPAYDTTNHLLYGKIIQNRDDTNLGLHVLLGLNGHRFSAKHNLCLLF